MGKTLCWLVAIFSLQVMKSSVTSRLLPYVEDSHLNRFAVIVDGDRKVADLVASELGFTVVREVIHAQREVRINRAKRNNEDYMTSNRKSSPKNSRSVDNVTPFSTTPIMTAYPTVVQFNDPYFGDMWYLKNEGQYGGEKFMDINIQVVWNHGYSGRNVVVTVLDDGLDYSHLDLSANYDPMASTDLNNDGDVDDTDPMPDKSNTLNRNERCPETSHGTRCAGEIASAGNNGVCGVGVAYNARIGGVRILDGVISDALEAEALAFNRAYVDIYSISWGPFDDGRTMEAPGLFAAKALKDGVRKGRGGLGSIFVWATGNGGDNGDDCNADGYTSSVETLSVGSVTDNGRLPFYMERCSSTMAVVPTGGAERKGLNLIWDTKKPKVVTTDLNNGCIKNFEGTSSAAPLVAGCLAAVLEAKSDLTWRDVQHLVVGGSRVPSVDDSWIINGAGRHVSHNFGFGLVDCGMLVQLAETWQPVTAQHTRIYHRHIQRALTYGGKVQDSVDVSVEEGERGDGIQRLEHVQVSVNMSTRRRGDISVDLISPSGTRSKLLSCRPKDSHVGEWQFTFMTVHSWDEDPAGEWLLEVRDHPRMSTLSWLRRDGIVKEWSLILHGTNDKRRGRASGNQNSSVAFIPSLEKVSQIKDEELHRSLDIQLKPYVFEKSVVHRTLQLNGTMSNAMDKLRTFIRLHNREVVKEKHHIYNNKLIEKLKKH